MYQMILSLLGLSFSLIVTAQNVGIGTTTPNTSAVLDATSTTQGFLPPRMTYAQRNAILNPAAGLIVYCTDCNGGIGEMNYYNGSTWYNMTIGVASNVVANTSVTIGNQVWMSKNLDVSSYRNGDIIPFVCDPDQWNSLTTGAWCWYNCDSVTYAATYGKLYNWYAVNDPRGLAPSGWHVPSDAEWVTLENYLGGPNVAGGALKEIGTSHWISPNAGATNISGFSALAGGRRGNPVLSISSIFLDFGASSNFWSSSEYIAGKAWVHIMTSGGADIDRSSWNKRFGFSIRCVKD